MFGRNQVRLCCYLFSSYRHFVASSLGWQINFFSWHNFYEPKYRNIRSIVDRILTYGFVFLPSNTRFHSPERKSSPNTSNRLWTAWISAWTFVVGSFVYVLRRSESERERHGNISSLLCLFPKLSKIQFFVAVVQFSPKVSVGNGRRFFVVTFAFLSRQKHRKKSSKNWNEKLE
jgi:hypothetical protein